MLVEDDLLMWMADAFRRRLRRIANGEHTIAFPGIWYAEEGTQFFLHLQIDVLVRGCQASGSNGVPHIDLSDAHSLYGEVFPLIGRCSWRWIVGDRRILVKDDCEDTCAITWQAAQSAFTLSALQFCP